MLKFIKNFLEKFKKVNNDDNDNVPEDVYQINNKNPFIAYEYAPDGIYIHVNKPQEIPNSKYAELLFSVNSGNLKTETMECVMESLNGKDPEKIIDEWGALEIQNQVLKSRLDNSRPLIGPRDFFRSSQ